MDVLSTLTQSDNPLIALLAAMVLVLSSVVVYQWRYTMNKTVPKWVWDMLIGKVDNILDTQNKTHVVIDTIPQKVIDRAKEVYPTDSYRLTMRAADKILDGGIKT